MGALLRVIVYLVCVLSWLQLGREVLDEAARAVEVGVTAEEIDALVHQVSTVLHLCSMPPQSWNHYGGHD